MNTRVFFSTLAACVILPAVVCAQNTLQEDLKASVVAAQAQLGALEPWQKKVFEEEVVPQYSRFVRNYRATQGGGANVDVDLEVLRKYLRFYAPKVLGRDAPQLLITLKPETTCAKCMEAEPFIRRLVKARVERRGFVPVFSGETKEADPKKLSGTLNMQWAMNPVDEAHAEEKTYRIQSALVAAQTAPATTPTSVESKVPTFKHEDKLELLENDSFETAAARLLTDTFTALGTQVTDAMAANTTEEFTVTISGIKGYDHYQKLKARLDTLKDSMVFDERKMSRGQVVFAIRTGKTLSDIKTALACLSLESGRLVLSGSDNQSLSMEIQ